MGPPIIPEGPITEEEKSIVAEFRKRVFDKIPSEELAKPEDELVAYLLRWLRARNLSLDKAESMMETALQWMKDKEPRKAVDATIDPFFTKNYRWTFVGKDLADRPVVAMPFAEWDFRKMINNNKLEQFETFMMNFFERILMKIEEQNAKRAKGQPPLTQFFIVCDTSNYNYWQLLNLRAAKKWFDMASTYEAYYPEVLFRVVFFNCPSSFQMFVNIMKGFLAPRTLNKFLCYPSLEEWQKDMGNYVDPSILPERYGGTRKTPTDIDICSPLVD